jgi:hypothetical protein
MNGENTEFDAYSDYQRVSRSIADDIHKATKSAAFIKRYHNESGNFEPREIAEAAAHIQSAAMMMDGQLEYYSNGDGDYQEILDVWRGEEGRISKLQDVDFVRECPDWLSSLIEEIHEAGLLLGYLQAGRENTVREIGDERDEAVDSMF